MAAPLVGDTIRNPSGSLPEESIRRTVLVVDDDEALQFFMRKILEPDYRIIAASSADEALAHLHGEEVDLVFLDLMLPGASGITICRRIRETWDPASISIIVLTARTDIETKVEALESGADDYITKPFHPRELLTRVKVQMRVRDLQRELVKSERLKAIVETAISANHEINNPLCAIITNVELLMRYSAVKQDDDILQMLESILTAAERIEKTLQKMVTIIQPAVSEYLPGVQMLDIAQSSSVEEHGVNSP
jgi:CheY-like chemotaxis protein